MELSLNIHRQPYSTRWVVLILMEIAGLTAVAGDFGGRTAKTVAYLI